MIANGKTNELEKCAELDSQTFDYDEDLGDDISYLNDALRFEGAEGLLHAIDDLARERGLSVSGTLDARLYLFGVEKKNGCIQRAKVFAPHKSSEEEICV